MSDRKYKQRGYMSSDGERKEGARSDSRSAPRPPRDPRDAPRGRGMGAPTVSNFRCARCGELSTVAAAAVQEARCGHCGADLHTCTHCSHFDPAAALQCRQPIAVRVAKKDVANRCALFEPRLAQEFDSGKPSPGAGSAGSGDPRDPRAAFDALFKF